MDQFPIAFPDGGLGAGLGHREVLDPGVALCRAVTEAMQSRGLIIAGSRDDQFGSGRDASLLHSNHYATPDSGRRDVIKRTSTSTGSIIGDIVRIVDALAGAGMPQVLVKRHTKPGDPVQVVRVIVPGLEGYRFEHYTPGPRAQAAMKVPAIA